MPSKKIRDSLQIIIILMLMFAFGFLPPIGTITPFGMKVLGVFLALIYAWTINIVMWPSLLGLIVLASYQGISMQAALASIVSNQTLLLICVVLAFCYALDSCGLLDFIGKWLMRQKIIQKGPYYLLAVFYIVGYVTSAVTLNSGAPLLMEWAIFYKIADNVGIKPFSRYSNAMLIGLAVITYQGQQFFPFSPWPNIVFGLYSSSSGTPFSIPPGFYMLMNLIAGALLITACLLVTKFIFKPETNFDLSKMQLDSQSELKMTQAQKFAACSLLVSVIFLLVPSLLPIGLLKTWMTNMSIIGIFILIMIMLSFYQNEKTGKPVAQLDTCVQNGINWQQFFLLALAFYIASLLTNESTGISTFILNVLNPVLGGLNTLTLVVMLIFITTLLTNCLNNVVSISLILPFVISLEGSGVNMVMLMTALTFVSLQGCALPSGSLIGGILHGNKERLKAKDIYLYALTYTLLLAIIMSILALIIG